MFHIGNLFAKNCDTLTSVKLEEALNGQSKVNIEKMVIVNCNTIDDSTFSGCIGLKEIFITNCSKIVFSAFFGCVNLKEVTISSCKEIGSFAFSGCGSLNIVQYQNPIEPIHGNDVFKDCQSLKTVYVPADYKSDSFCEISVTKKAPASTLTPTPASKSKSNKTALIAPIVSVAAVIVIAGVVFATCYIKKHTSFFSI